MRREPPAETKRAFDAIPRTVVIDPWPEATRDPKQPNSVPRAESHGRWLPDR